MKKLAAIFFLFAFLLTALRDTSTLVAFKINQAEIVDSFCVNIYEPELMCSGKCFLADQIEQNQEQREQLPSPDDKQFTLYFDEIATMNDVVATASRSACIFEVTYAFEWNHSIFHPPRNSTSA